MSMYFEAVVLSANQYGLTRLLKGLAELDESDRIASMALKPFREFSAAVAVHYDDQVGLHTAMLSRNGVPVRYFGEQDEVWVPYGADGEPRTDGPRYAGNAVPDDVECDCIWNGIDAALEAAGFRKWITAHHLAAHVAYSAHQDGQPWWHRPGVREQGVYNGKRSNTT